MKAHYNLDPHSGVISVGLDKDGNPTKAVIVPGLAGTIQYAEDIVRIVRSHEYDKENKELTRFFNCDADDDEYGILNNPDSDLTVWATPVKIVAGLMDEFGKEELPEWDYLAKELLIMVNDVNSGSAKNTLEDFEYSFLNAIDLSRSVNPPSVIPLSIRVSNVTAEVRGSRFAVVKEKQSGVWRILNVKIPSIVIEGVENAKHQSESMHLSIEYKIEEGKYDEIILIDYLSKQGAYLFCERYKFTEYTWMTLGEAIDLVGLPHKHYPNIFEVIGEIVPLPTKWRVGDSRYENEECISAEEEGVVVYFTEGEVCINHYGKCVLLTSEDEDGNFEVGVENEPFVGFVKRLHKS